MKGSSYIRVARTQMGMSQRDLARVAGIAQPAIARLESGRVSPTIDTLERILRACGQELRLERRLGTGVDRSVLRSMLDMTVQQRARLAVDEARNVQSLGDA